MTDTKKTIYTAICITLGIVLPIAFHSLPNAGGIFLPMHIPVLLCGLLCGWPYGLLCGAAAPLLSGLFTGMPPAPLLPGMMVELAVYGLSAGFLMGMIRTKIFYVDLYISLIPSMLVGRIVSGIAKAWIFTPGAYSMVAWVTASFITALPGLVIQLLIIPSIVYALEAADLIPKRYPKP